MKPTAVCLIIVAALLLGGCYAPLPTYPPMAPDAAVKTLVRRDSVIHAIRSPCDVTLRNASGSSVNFDAAIVAQWPDHMRLRAWKFGQPAFDVTFSPDGLWLYMPEEARKRAGESANFTVTADQFRRVWNLLDPAAMSAPNLVATSNADGSIITVTRPLDAARPGQGMLECDIEASTLTIREYRFVDPDKKVRQTLRFGTYRVLRSDVGPIVWPTSIDADGESGRILIRLSGTEFNPDLNPAIFTPPKRAVKQP